MRYVEERQRRRWPRAAITHRAQGGCGLIQRQNSSPMLSHRNRHPSLSEPSQDPCAGPAVLLQQPSRLALCGRGGVGPRQPGAMRIAPVLRAPSDEAREEDDRDHPGHDYQ